MIRHFWMRLLSRISRITSWNGFWWVVAVVCVLVIGIVFTWCNWNVLRGGQVSVSATLRNVGLLIGGVIAIILALWRSRVAERQADTALRQSKTAERGLLNERYQKGAEMLGNKVISVRLGGIYALRRLAEQHPQEYHIQIMQLFCAFARHPTTDDATQIEPNKEHLGEIVEGDEDVGLVQLRMDVEAVMEAIALRSKKNVELESRVEYHLDLRGAYLHGLFWGNFENVNLRNSNLGYANLSGANFRANTNLSRVHAVKADLSNACLTDLDLSRSILWSANLSDTLLMNSDLSHTSLEAANLSGADLRGANLTRTLLKDANLSGTIISLEDGGSPVRGLTQSQLDEATADPNNPPKIDHGAIDGKSGELLVWRRNPSAGI